MGQNRMGPPCPECGSLLTNVYRTARSPNQHFWRKRECPACGHRFSTLQPAEVVSPPDAVCWSNRAVSIHWGALRGHFVRLITSGPC